MIANVALLSLAYKNGDKQEQKTSFIQVDRFDSQPYNLGENGVEISLFAEDFDNFDLNLFQLSVYQLQSCDDDSDAADCESNGSRKLKIGEAEECSEDRKV